ncbi:MAG: four helix bundle protein [Kiritimatiellia bacterium]
MSPTFPHESLEVYQRYLSVTGQCEELISQGSNSIVALDHLDRAMESIGVNLMRANAQKPGSAQRTSSLDVSIASTHECAASLDVCFARCIVEGETHEALLMSLWRIRGMLLGMKRVGTHCVWEERTAYGSPCFPFANLDMYRLSLEGAGWIHELLEELSPKARMRKKLDISTTGTVLNIAEGHGRTTPADQNRFMKMAEEHAFQTILMLDLLVSRREVDAARIEGGKTMQGRVISMLHAWCAKNGAT